MKPESNGGSAWITKSEALHILGISERSLDRLVTKGTVEKRTRPRPGRTPEPVYMRSDVENAASPPAHVMPVSEHPRAGLHVAEHQAAPAQAAENIIAQLLAGLTAVLTTAPRAIAAPPEPAARPQWLDLPAASTTSGLSERLLRSLIDGGMLPAIRDGRTWKMRAEDLSAIRASNSANRAKGRATAKTRAGGGLA